MDQMGYFMLVRNCPGCIHRGFGVQQVGPPRKQIGMGKFRRTARHADDLVIPRQKGFGQVRTDPLIAPGDDCSVAHASSTNASTRKGLPVPFLIFSGAAIRTAPVGGS